MKHELVTLEGIAVEVRSAIEGLSVRRDPIVLAIEALLRDRGVRQRYGFPCNWCDFASCTLAGTIARELKREVRLAQWDAENEMERHWWVRCGSVDIDITGDQFEKCPASVIVQCDSPWHRERFPGTPAIALAQRPLQSPQFELLLRALEVRVEGASVPMSTLRLLGRIVT